MIQFINEYGMTNAIDTVMQKSADHLNVAYLEPLLVVLDMNKEGDTDIQFNFESCARDIISLIQDEVRFLIKLGEKDYTISKFEKEGDYTYKLDSAFVVVNNPSDKLRQLRPNQRLIGCDGKFTI
jgi:hypothetical protein